MNSSSSCCGGSLSGCWADEQQVEPQVVAVRHLRAEVALDAGFQMANVLGRSSWGLSSTPQR